MTKRTYIIAFAAALVNSYDYALLGLAATKLSYAFFPGDSEVNKIINFFIVFAATISIRPFAALIFGILGDKYGRAFVLKIAALGISVPTFIIAFIPSFASFGYFSCFMFIVCRLLIIAFLSGEVDGVRIYVYEKIAPKKQFLGSGLVTGCNQAGSLIASLSLWITTSDYFPENFWRINFIIGGAAGFMILILREYFQESQEFLEYKQTSDFTNYSNMNIFKIIKENANIFFIAILCHGAIGAIFHFQIIFFSFYPSTILKIVTEQEIKFIITLTIFAYMSSAFISGVVLSNYNPRIITSIALAISIILATLNAYFIRHGVLKPWILVSIGGLTPFYSTAIFVFLKRKLKTGVKYRVFSFAHAVGSVIFSSTTPFIAIKLWHATNIAWIPIVYFIFLLTSLLLITNLTIIKNAT